jgi:hypothetical protein
MPAKSKGPIPGTPSAQMQKPEAGLPQKVKKPMPVKITKTGTLHKRPF